MDELKPCPFCGCKSIALLELYDHSFCVSCNLCDAEIEGWDRETAVKAWNRRVSDESERSY